MGEFKAGISERVAEARRALESARLAGDDYSVGVHAAELEDLLRIADDHDIDLRHCA